MRMGSSGVPRTTQMEPTEGRFNQKKKKQKAGVARGDRN